MNKRRFFSTIGLAFFLMIILDLGVQTLLTLIINAAFPSAIYFHSNLKWIISAISQYAVAMPVCAIVLLRLPAVRLLGGRLVGTGWFSLLCVSLFIGQAGNLIGRGLSALIGNLTGLSMTYSVQDMMTNESLWLLFLLVVIAGPILEELIFRKLIIDRAVVFGDLTAIILSASVFGLMHGNLYQFFYAFGLGCIFGYIYIRTGKIAYTISLHMAFNFLGGFVGSAFINRLTSGSGSLNEIMYYSMSHLGALLGLILYALLIVALAIAGLVVFIVNIKKITLKKGEYTMPPGRTAKAILANPGMILFIIAVAAMFIINMI